MPRPSLVALTLLAAGGALAQEPDTLDARGYFPLDVGNEWEYTLWLQRPAYGPRAQDESRREYERLHIVGLTPDSARYLLVWERFTETSALLWSDTLAVRWDSITASVLGLYTGPNGVPHEDVSPGFACELDAPFEMRLDGRCWVEVRREEIRLTDLFGTAEPRPGKLFMNYVYGYTAIHGVGFVWIQGGCHPCSPFSDMDSATLTFARVGGVAYGARRVGAEASPIARPGRVEVYPNPSGGEVSVQISPAPSVQTTAEVFDLLGRRIGSFPVEPGAGPTLLDLRERPPGVYLVRVGGSVTRVTLR